MNVDKILDDVDQHIQRAPVVTLDEWGRQSIRRLQGLQHVIRLLVAKINEQDPT